MNVSPARWTDSLWRAVVTLLAAAGAVWLAARLFATAWPLLLILAVVVGALRLAVGWRGRSGW